MANGVPMVTRPMEHVRGRYAAGMYNQMGPVDLVTYTSDKFVDAAARLLTDTDYYEAQAHSVNRCVLLTCLNILLHFNFYMHIFFT